MSADFPDGCVAWWLQNLATGCVELLRAVADALSGWSAAVGRAVQQRQQQQQINNIWQPALHSDAALQLHEASTWLPAAACSLLISMQQLQFSSAVKKRQLLHTLGRLLQEVLSMCARHACKG